MGDWDSTIVLDIGSGDIKAGWAVETLPSFAVPNVIGRLQSASASAPTVKIGDQLEEGDYRFFTVTWPVQEGVVRSWEDLEAVLRYVVTEKLECTVPLPRGSRVVLVAKSGMPLKQQAKLLRLMWDKLGFQYCYLAQYAEMVLLALGGTTGVVIDVGYGVSQVVPIAQGVVQEHFTQRLNVGGRHITDYLCKLMSFAGYYLNPTADLFWARETKERLCYVAVDVKKERKLAAETVALVANRRWGTRTIRLSKERFEAAEVLFSPELVADECEGMAEVVYKVITKCDIDNRAPLWQNIILTGASSTFSGLDLRLKKELRKQILEKVCDDSKERLHAWEEKIGINVAADENRAYQAFCGAAYLAQNLPAESWCNKAEPEKAQINFKALSKIEKSAD